MKHTRPIFTLAMLGLVITLAGCGKLNKEITACEQFEAVIESGMCINNIALAQDSLKSALNVCDQIESGVKNTCTRNVAVKFEVKELCYENPNEVEKYVCLANLAEMQKDPSICPEITSMKDRGYCYRQVAVATLDESHCANIVDNDEYRQTCMDSVEYARQVLSQEAQNGEQ